MAVNPNWPLTVTSVATGTNPFDSNNTTTTAPYYVDISSRVEELEGGGGRQYELDQPAAGEASIVVNDKDEAFNPTNPNSPYYPGVQPYRLFADQAMWPPTPTGGAVNLINTSSSVPIDPSFESYTVGSTPANVNGLSVTPTVTTTTPFQGTQDLTWTTTASSTIQGIFTTLVTIPQQQYTASVYLRQTTASLQQLTISGLTTWSDTFNRTVANGWGTPTIGGAYTVSGGSASDYSVSAGTATATQKLSTVNVLRSAIQSTQTNIANVDLTVTVAIGQVSTGASVDAYVLCRYVDANNHYRLGLTFNTDSSITAKVTKVVAGTETSLGTASTGLFYGAGGALNLRIQCSGNTLRVLPWYIGSTQPAAFTLIVTDTSLPTQASVGLGSIARTGNTNTAPTIGFASLNTNLTLAASTTTTGAYTRLTVTFTAQKPTHTMAVTTNGTALAGTTNLDAIQLEPGSSASTFATSGPVIYGVFAGFVERWPSTWRFQGTYGQAHITAVDALAVLQGILLYGEQRNSTIAKAPTYYWPLSEGQGATYFGEASGNAGPPMYIVQGGSGGTVTAGTGVNITGDPNGTAVAISGGSASTPNGAVVQVGGNGQPLSVGGSGSSWSVSFAFSAIPQTGAAGTFFVVNNPSTNYALSVERNNVDQLWIRLVTPTGTYDGSLSTFAYNPIEWLFTGVLTINGTSTTTTLYINAQTVSSFSGTTSTVFGTATPTVTLTYCQLAGRMDPTVHFVGNQGTYSHVALWNRALSSTEINDLEVATVLGYLGESSGARVSRYLGYSKLPSRTAVSTGSSTMGAAVVDGSGQSGLDAILAVVTTENGNLFADGLGVITFTGRGDRYLNTTAKWSFGENQAGGQAPYSGNVTYSFDPQQVYNAVQVTRTSGITVFNDQGVTATGGLPADILASQNAYGVRAYSRQVNTKSDLEAMDAANWIFYTHMDPEQRIDGVELDPASNPTLWPIALGARIGDRVTVHRVTSAGYTMSGDFFIEKKTHARKPGEWKVTFQLSPVALLTVGLFNDPNHGQFDVSFVMAY